METTVSGFGTDEILSRRLSKLLRYGLKPVALLVDVPPTVDATVQNIDAVTTGRLVGSRPRVCRCPLLEPWQRVHGVVRRPFSTNSLTQNGSSCSIDYNLQLHSKPQASGQLV